MNPQDEALKPCPFCGGDAHWCPTFIDTDEPGTVTCTNGCGATVICAGSKAVRIAAWNTRLSHSTPGDAEGLTVADAWQDLVDKDDRTSPEEYPDMALITREELADYMRAATPSGRAQGEVKWRTDEPPKDRTVIYRRVISVYRFQPYKPNSQQFKQGLKGRWQEMNEYGGWDNCNHPLGNEWTNKDPFATPSTPEIGA